MFNVFLKLFPILIVLCGMDFSQSFAQDALPVFPENEILDFDDPRLELWYGTELDPLHLPGIVWMDGGSSTNEKNIGGSGNLKLISRKSADTKLKSKKKPVKFRGSGESKASLAFAEPFDFNVWILVKWTVVVLVLAGIATFFLRGKFVRLPTPQSSREMTLIESLVVDQRSRLHLVEVGGERFLVATDLTGVKSTTLIPNWNLDEEIGDRSIGSNESMNNSTAISISEAG